MRISAKLTQQIWSCISGVGGGVGGGETMSYTTFGTWGRGDEGDKISKLLRGVRQQCLMSIYLQTSTL